MTAGRKPSKITPARNFSEIKPRQRFGLLTALEPAGVIERQGRHRIRRYRMWRFACNCGRKTVASAKDVRSGNTKSCGCRKKLGRLTHGHTSGRRVTSEYSCWMALRARCYDKTHVAYGRYGGRGIRVCKQWRHSFETFLSNMGLKPSKRHSIERIDPSGNYEPDNCRWATDREQARNTRRTIHVKIGGNSICLKDACRKVGLRYQTVRRRLKLGWPMERALKERPQKGRWH